MFGLKFMVNVACTTDAKEKILIVKVQHGEIYLGKGGKPTNFRFPTDNINEAYKKVTELAMNLFGKSNVNLNNDKYTAFITKYDQKLTSFLLGMSKLSQEKTLDGKLDS